MQSHAEITDNKNLMIKTLYEYLDFGIRIFVTGANTGMDTSYYMFLAINFTVSEIIKFNSTISNEMVRNRRTAEDIVLVRKTVRDLTHVRVYVRG